MCDAGHELRITRRCLADDFTLDSTQPFEELSDAHEIVQAFQAKRDATTVGAKTVGPAAGDRTIYHLGRGNDHRGATWYDVASRVVWLCAYRFHRSGTPNDAFPYFNRLIASRAIWPLPEDYAWLQADRAARLAEQLPEAAQSVLTAARAAPGQEHRARIGRGDVGVLVQVVETLEETYVALDMRTVDGYPVLVTLLASFYPQRLFTDWVPRSRLPNRALGPAELCFSTLHG